MGFREWLERKPKGAERRNWSAWRLLTAWIVALTVAAVILLAFEQGMVGAGVPPSGAHGKQETESTISGPDDPVDWAPGEAALLRITATEGLPSEQLRRCTRRPC